MTDATRTEPETFFERKLQELRAACQQSGMKLTHQRMEILRELSNTTEHPTAETIFRRVRAKLPSVSLDTVYRTLGTFAELGLVEKINVAHEQSRFDADISPHHHLVCSRCKAIEDFTWSEFDALELPEEAAGWGRTESAHVIVTGVCRRCQNECTAAAVRQ